MARVSLFRWLVWLAGGLIGLCVLGTAAFFGGFLLLSAIVRTPEVIVPSVYGLPEADAIKILVQAGLTIDVPIEYEENDQLEEGLVIEQSPRPNIRVKEGRRIQLTVSKGAKRIMIPDLVGRMENEILPTLEHLDLVEGHRSAIYHDTVERGVIIAQNPPPGEALLYGKSVSILVSLGPRPKAYVMPDRIGSAVDETVGSFREMGFSVVVDRQEVSSPEEWDRILDQEPPAGAKLVQGSEVTFTVGVKQIQPERVRLLNIPLPEFVTGKFVTVAVYGISDGHTGDPETFKVPVTDASDAIRISIPFRGKIRVEIYDGAAEGGALLFTRTFEAQPDTLIREIQE